MDSSIKPSKQEIKKKLSELNLTLDPSLVRSRRKWFDENKIKIFLMYQRFYLQQDGVDRNDLVSHIARLNEINISIRELLLKSKKEGLPQIKRERGIYVSKDNPYVEQLNLYVQETQTIKLWLKERNFIAKLITIENVTYYSLKQEL